MLEQYKNNDTGAIVYAMQWDGTQNGYNAIVASANSLGMPHDFAYSNGYFTIDKTQYVNPDNYVIYTGTKENGSWVDGIWYAQKYTIFLGTNTKL